MYFFFFTYYQNVKTQTSSKPTEKEKKLRYRIKILQSKLHRKELEVSRITRLLEHIKCNYNRLIELYGEDNI